MADNQTMSITDDQVAKKLAETLAEKLDKKIENKVNALLIKVLGVKWHTLVALLTALALYFAGFTYMNNQAMSSLKSDIVRLEKTLNGAKN